ncbi:Imm30 family immunity protein [Bacillus sp. DX1.1]|uniref:Imm30 family immunity protein n=1 Tax=unclassified Bacillus (in: firmicutes) TaxID=185979 RepID=UPI002570BF2B|nr:MULTISPECIES: Imm30 family immunity protein [unclassified Bacillus (in: firmicutes)]MDM5155434.1 Imm30 family immunity protein [Bacillus sp. DX1.1]WJE79747.1 Imm30 family immunity protein [Bacillus sp. DX3.1]
MSKDYEDEEVMFGLVHAIESYYSNSKKELYFREFIDAMINMESNAIEWIKIMNIRILNNKDILPTYIHVVKRYNVKVKSFFEDIMKEIEREDSEMFSNSVHMFLKDIR